MSIRAGRLSVLVSGSVSLLPSEIAKTCLLNFQETLSWMVFPPILDIDAILTCSTMNYFSHTSILQMGMVELLTHSLP